MGAKSTTTQNVQPYGAAAPALDRAFWDAKSIYDAGGFRVDPYQGDLVAQFDPLRQQAYNAAPGLVSGVQGGLGASQDALMRAMDPLARSDAWGQVKQNIIADIMPSINASFAGSGMTGSELHAQNLAKGLSAGLAGAEVDAWQQGENRALAAAGMMPQIGAAQFGANTYLDQIGGGMQAYNQSQIEADVLRDFQGQTAQRDAIADYIALISGASAPFASTTQTSKKRPGLLDFLSLGAGLA